MMVKCGDGAIHRNLSTGMRQVRISSVVVRPAKNGGYASVRGLP
jgi:hypothetical protein